MTPTLTTTPAPWYEGFTPFGWQHLLAVLACAAVGGFIIASARRRRGTPAERAIRRGWAWGTFIIALAVDVYWFMPSRYTIGESLPLHLCDIAAWAAPMLMLSKHRWPKSLMFFWGVGLSTQGFITPTIEQGIGDPFYWLYWLQHLGVVGGGIYLAVAAGYRPRLGDLAFAFLFTLALGIAMMTLDLALGVNYMYVGNQLPERPTILDALGPWPRRLVWLALLVLLAFTLTWAVSEAIHRAARRPTRPSPENS